MRYPSTLKTRVGELQVYIKDQFPGLEFRFGELQKDPSENTYFLPMYIDDNIDDKYTLRISDRVEDLLIGIAEREPYAVVIVPLPAPISV